MLGGYDHGHEAPFYTPRWVAFFTCVKGHTPLPFLDLTPTQFFEPLHPNSHAGSRNCERVRPVESWGSCIRRAREHALLRGSV